MVGLGCGVGLTVIRVQWLVLGSGRSAFIRALRREFLFVLCRPGRRAERGAGVRGGLAGAGGDRRSLADLGAGGRLWRGGGRASGGSESVAQLVAPVAAVRLSLVEDLEAEDVVFELAA